jgi:hypothetical protein
MLPNLALLLVGTAGGLIASEWIARSTDFADRFAWNLAPSVRQRVQSASVREPGEVRILGLGDSFAEFREHDGGNFYRLVEERARAAGFDLSLVNLGEAGTGVKQYLANLRAYREHLDPDLAIFAIFLGNDLLDYEMDIHRTRTGLRQHVGASASTGLTEVKAYVKRRSIILNSIARLMKEYIPPLRSDTFDKNVSKLREIYGADGDAVSARLDRIGHQTAELARADLINPWDLAFGVVRPDLYTEMLTLSQGSAFPQALALMLTDFDEIVAYCAAYGIVPAFVLIPPSIQVDSRYHAHFRRLGYTVPDWLVGPLPLNRALGAYFGARAIAYLDVLPSLLERAEDPFLDNDIHFNSKGQQLAGDALFAFLRDRGLMAMPRPR